LDENLRATCLFTPANALETGTSILSGDLKKMGEFPVIHDEFTKGYISPTFHECLWLGRMTNVP